MEGIVLERITRDLTDMVDGLQGYQNVLTVIEHYSKFVRSFPLKRGPLPISQTSCGVIRRKGAPTTSVFIPFQPSGFVSFVPNDCLLLGGEPSRVSPLVAEGNESILNLMWKPSAC